MAKASDGKRKKHRVKGYLCAAFAAVACVTSVGSAVALTHHGSPAPKTPASASSLINIFGATAERAPLADSPAASLWEGMLAQQQKDMKNPLIAEKYDLFLGQFDSDKGEPLMKMMLEVNVADQGEIAYTDDTNCSIPDMTQLKCSTIDKGANFHWLSPAEIVERGKGNCVNQAILQYFIMRYLGVPANRLFLAEVGAAGAPKSAGPDHMILVVNTAAKGQKQNLIVMNDAGPLENASRYIAQGNAPFKPITWPISRTEGGAWDKPYIFFNAFNGGNSWLTINYSAQSGQQTTASSLPVAAKFSIKLG